MSGQSSHFKRGILKSQSWRLPKCERANNVEPTGLKSVLKKDQNKGSSPEKRSSRDLHSILKVSKERGSSSSETESEDEKPNTNSDLIDLLHKVILLNCLLANISTTIDSLCSMFEMFLIPKWRCNHFLTKRVCASFFHWWPAVLHLVFAALPVRSLLSTPFFHPRMQFLPNPQAL